MGTADDGIFLMSGEGQTISLPDRGARAAFKATGEDTGGRFAIVESCPAPGAPGLPGHRHRRSDEALYVLEGQVVIRLGDRTLNAPAGSFAFIPRGTVHMFRNPGPLPARVLVIFVPAGLERFLEETAAAFATSGGAPAPSVLEEIRANHDTELVDDHRPLPPGRAAGDRSVGEGM